MRNYSMVLTEKQLKRIMYNTYPNKDYFDLNDPVKMVYRSTQGLHLQSNIKERKYYGIRGDLIMTKTEYEKALEEREKILREEKMKAFPLTEEEIEELKKQGRI